jgi:hypothetical protein
MSETTENEYLELADHCKKLVENKDKELTKMKEENIELKKLLMVSYGFTRVIDYYSDDEEIAQECRDLLEMLRGYLSSQLDVIFFKEEINLN